MLEYCQLSWVSILSGTLSHGTLSSSFLKRLHALFAAVRISNSTKASLKLHIAHQPLLVGENRVQHTTSLCWLFYHLEKDI